MSAVEQSVNQAIEDFARSLAAFSPFSDEDARRLQQDIAAALREALHAQLPYILTGGSSRLICDMPNNRHSFSSANPKHCAHCGADFCTSHSLSHCVKCGHTV